MIIFRRGFRNTPFMLILFSTMIPTLSVNFKLVLYFRTEETFFVAFDLTY